MKADGLRLGQEGERSDEGAWLFIAFNDGKYVTWSEEDDGDIREILTIAPKQKLPRIRVRRWDIPQRMAFVKKGLAKYRKVGNDIPQEAQEKVILESAATVILVDWELIAMKDGKMHAYTPEVGKKAFKESPGFYDAVVEAALNSEYHRAKLVQEDAESLGEV